MTAFDDLMGFARETAALEQVSGRLGWDQETMMAEGSGEQRAEEMAAMEGVLHARRIDPRVGDWLAAIDADTLDHAGRAQLRHIRRDYERASKVPARLAAEIARVTSRAQRIWAGARAADDVSAFTPILSEVLALRREEAQALANGGDLYDALLNDYEPGATQAEIAALFDAMRPRLVALRAAILERPEPKGVTGTFDEAGQIALSRVVAQAFGYDLNRGRIDKAVHPFSSGSGNDVRITTRTNPADPFNCLYSTIHETGHACYEQGIDQAYLLTPLGKGVSMGVHESQSRIYENQLGRSHAFTGWLYDQMTQTFGDFGIADAEAFYAAVNRVQKGYIRTESDEVQAGAAVPPRGRPPAFRPPAGHGGWAEDGSDRVAAPIAARWPPRHAGPATRPAHLSTVLRGRRSLTLSRCHNQRHVACAHRFQLGQKGQHTAQLGVAVGIDADEQGRILRQPGSKHFQCAGPFQRRTVQCQRPVGGNRQRRATAGHVGTGLRHGW